MWYDMRYDNNNKIMMRYDVIWCEMMMKKWWCEIMVWNDDVI